MAITNSFASLGLITANCNYRCSSVKSCCNKTTMHKHAKYFRIGSKKKYEKSDVNFPWYFSAKTFLLLFHSIHNFPLNFLNCWNETNFVFFCCCFQFHLILHHLCIGSRGKTWRLLLHFLFKMENKTFLISLFVWTQENDTKQKNQFSCNIITSALNPSLITIIIIFTFFSSHPEKLFQHQRLLLFTSLIYPFFSIPIFWKISFALTWPEPKWVLFWRELRTNHNRKTTFLQDENNFLTFFCFHSLSLYHNLNHNLIKNAFTSSHH